MRISDNRKTLLWTVGPFILAIAAIAVALLLTSALFDPNGVPIWAFVQRCALLVAGIFLFLLGLAHLIRLPISGLPKNLISAFVVALIISAVLEAILSLTPISSGGDKVLFSRNWMNFYWTENPLGYRDAEPTEIDRPDKKNILIVGDSYVAGHGLKHEEERFSNLLREQLKSRYDVFNLGVCGADTKDELGFLKSFPVRPDLVILVHGKNDIQKVRPRSELRELLNIDSNILEKLPKPSGRHSFVIQNSFLLNSVEYLTYKMREKDFFNGLVDKYKTLDEFLRSEDGGVSYLSYYKNDRLFAAHLAHVDSIARWTDAQNAQFLLVLFPATEDQLLLETDRLINRPIVKHMEQRSVSTLNLTPVLLSYSETDRQVSRLDPHPSILLNRAVADTLSGLITEKLNGAVDRGPDPVQVRVE